MTGNQLKEIIRKSGITQEVAAQKMGITRRTIQNWFRMDQLDANISQIVKDSGFSDAIYDTDQQARYDVNQQHQGRPYYDVDFINGFDLVQNDQSVNPAYHINFPQYNNADFWVNATGDSMKPLINHGDIVALRKIEDWATYMLFGEIYAFVTEEYRTIKRVRKSEKGEGFLRFEPLNTIEYDEQDVPVAAIRAVFQVIGCAKKIF